MSAPTTGDKRLGLAEQRARNLRQLLLGAHREINAIVAFELARRGHTDIRLIHSRLLENLDREGNSITAVAKRAQMTKQAMGSLAKELETKGYLRRVVDENDRRSWLLCFTTKGWRLMLETFDIVAEVERTMRARLGTVEFKTLQAGLAAMGQRRPAERARSATPGSAARRLAKPKR